MPDQVTAPIVTALLTNGLTATFTKPSDNGKPILYYIMTATPNNPPREAVLYGAVTVSANSSTVGGATGEVTIPSPLLVAGVSYTLTVTASNPFGPSPTGVGTIQVMCDSVPGTVPAPVITGRTTTITPGGPVRSVTFDWGGAVASWYNWTNGQDIIKWNYGYQNQFPADCIGAPAGATLCGSDDKSFKKTNGGDAATITSSTATGLRPGYPYAAQAQAINNVRRIVGNSCGGTSGNKNSLGTFGEIFYTLPEAPEAPAALSLAAVPTGQELQLALPYPGLPQPAITAAALQAPWANGAPITGCAILAFNPSSTHLMLGTYSLCTR